MDKKCLECGEFFKPINGNQKFCNSECKANYHNNKRRIEKLRCIECKNCGKIFQPRSSNQQNCNKECSKEFHAKKWQSDKKYPNGFGTTYCLECGIKFEKTSATNKFCNTKCRSRHYAKKQNQENNSIYVKDIENYVSSLVDDGLEARKKNLISFNYKYNMINESLRNNILYRDNYECKVCFANTNLEVHHIIKLIDGGDNNHENLITVCRSCHRAIDTLNKNHAIPKCTKNFIKNSTEKTTKHKNANNVINSVYDIMNYLYKDIESCKEIDIEAITNSLSEALDIIEEFND